MGMAVYGGAGIPAVYPLLFLELANHSINPGYFSVDLAEPLFPPRFHISFYIAGR